MEIRVFDKEIMPLGIVDEMDTLIWQSTYWQQGEYGDVKILAPITDNNNKLLVTGNIIVNHSDSPELSTDAGEWRRGAQITYKTITKDEKGTEQIEAQATLLKKWLSKRVVESQVVTAATNQNIINRLIAENCGSSAAQKRQFPQFEVLAQEDLGGTVIDYSNDAYVDLGLEIHNRAAAGKLGYDILINERSRMYGFYLYKGRDFTATNTAGNTPCIFSRDFDNVNEQEYTESIENCKNVVYVEGAADSDNTRYTVEVEKEESSGYDREEVYIEASDISWTAKTDDGEEITIDLDTYLKLLATRGDTELDSYGIAINFVSTINTTSNLKYKRGFKVGDIITCIEKKWGIKIDARIISVTQTYQNEKTTIEVTFGDSLPTLIEQIRKVR